MGGEDLICEIRYKLENTYLKIYIGFHIPKLNCITLFFSVVKVYVNY